MKRWLVILMVSTFLLIGCETEQNVGSVDVSDVTDIAEVEEVEDVQKEEEVSFDYKVESLNKIRILPERLNVREFYSVDSEVLTMVHKGAIYDIFQTSVVDEKVWYKIRYDKDQYGWIAGWYVSELNLIDETESDDFDHLVVKVNKLKSPYITPDNISKLDDVLPVGKLYEIYDNVIDEDGVIWYKICRNHVMSWITSDDTEVYLSNGTYTIADDAVVHFEDPDLESMIRVLLDLKSDFIRYRDVKDIETLRLDENFESLSGLEYFTSLKSLECRSENVKLFDLVKLHDLEVLVLRDTVVDDFELISQFDNLRYLDITGSEVETLYPIKALRRLTNIGLSEEYMDDLNALQLMNIMVTTVNMEVPEIVIEFDSEVVTNNTVEDSEEVVVSNFTIVNSDQSIVTITSVDSVEVPGSTGTVIKNDNVRPLVVSSSHFNGDFYSGWTDSSYDKNIKQLVWGFGLMTDSPSGKVVDSPMVEKKSVSGDMRVWTFKIKDGIKFHNGEELSVSDIKFTYEFYMDLDALRQTGGSSSMQDRVEKIDIDEAADTITFTLTSGNYTTDENVFYEMWILPEDTIEAGATANNMSVQSYVKDNISSPIGYGPYIFDEYKESEYIRLIANPDYIGKSPEIKEIIVKVVEWEHQFDQVLAGNVDLISRTVDNELITAAKANKNLNVESYFRHGGGAMILHTDYEAFSLTEVRQAFAYAYNRPKVVDLFLGEYGISEQAPYSKNQWMMYDNDEKNLIGTGEHGRFENSLTEYDILDANGNFDEAANILKAQELLDKAVKRTDGDYVYLTGDRTSGYMWKNEPLDIKVVFTAFWTDTYKEVWNHEYVSKLGFKVTLESLDWPIMYGHWTGDISEDRKYHAFVGGMGYSIKSNPINSYSTDRIMPWGQPSDNGSRFSGGLNYTPEEWDQLLSDIENCHSVTENDKYQKLWREYIINCNEELPILPIYSNNYHDIYSADLENYDTHALWPWTRAILDANWK